MFHEVMQGMMALMTWTNFLYMMVGSIIGLVVGILPGIGGALAVAILLPACFGLPPDTALVMLLGLFSSGKFGGAFGAILFNIPGTAAAAATAMDGYPMNLKGEAANAIMFSNVASLYGGVFGTLALLIFSPVIAKFALNFSAPEYALVAIFGLTIIGSLSGKDVLKGLIAGCLGLLLGTMGSDPWRGFPRFFFDVDELLDRLDIVWVLVAVFGGAQGFQLVKEFFEQKSSQFDEKMAKKEQKPYDLHYVIKKSYQSHWLLFRSSLIGTIVGAAPGVGGAVASWVAYDSAKKMAKNSEEFGTGIPEGVLASECSDNACASGDLIPLFTLGIPGGSMAAVLMGAFLILGIELGPKFFMDHAVLAYEIIISLFVTTMISLIICVFLVKPSAKIASLPTNVVIPLVFCLGVIGAYGSRTSLFGVYVFFILGFISYLLKCVDIPLPPIVIGFILGPIAEANIQRTLSLFKNNLWLIFTRPICIVLILLIIGTLILPVFKKGKVVQKIPG